MTVGFLSEIASNHDAVHVRPTAALLGPEVLLSELRYILRTLSCVDAVCGSFVDPNEYSSRFAFPAPLTPLQPVPPQDPQPPTWTISSLLADRPDPLILLSGCFDLIHAGHVGMIQQAAELGAEPVVAALTTRGIRTQPKNSAGDRPFWSMEDRVTVLQSLRSNPRVLLFDGPDCLELIDQLRPDIWIKEQRDRDREIVAREARLAESLGARIVWVDERREGRTSTAIAARLKKSSQ